LRRRLAEAALAALILIPLLPAGAARAAEYEMPTDALYVVDPSAGHVVVRVAVTFTNTLPDPPGQISAFTHIDLALQAGASAVVAADASGALRVDLARSDRSVVASVRTRSRVRYQQSVAFTLSYELADAAAADLHVRPEIVRFPAWSFGTKSQVTVKLPAGYEARADGDPMLTHLAGANLELTSGPIADPARWLALVTAVHPGDLVTQSASVALASGTVDLQVRAWSEDRAWGERTLGLLVKALPLLEEAIGLPYPRVGALVITEAAGGETSTGLLPSANAEIRVAFDAPDFIVLHQVAHIWINEQLAADRWIREGLASHYAARVAVMLQLAPPPYDPSAQTSELAADAVPLVDWRPGPTSGAADAYGYAASWALVDRIAKAVGEAPMAQALQRVAAGVSAYDPLEPVAAADGRPFAPVTTGQFLDQLGAVSDVDVAAPFRALAFGADHANELEARAAARESYARLLRAAGDWGAPDPVRAAMADWRFDEAKALMSQASAWLEKRDALVAAVAAAHLAVPDRLRARYSLGGGGPEASAELNAERAAVAAYAALRDRVAAPRGPLDAIGLWFAEDPDRVLMTAAEGYRLGDLRASGDALDRLELELNQAPSDGAVRLAAAIVLLALVCLAMGVALRRRSGSHYTAAP
jgi:hypothetical protein